MALVSQPWRYVGTAVAGGVNVSDYLATLQTILASATYDGGAARTAGAGNAWSVESTEGAPLEALLLSPPTGSPASGKVLIAGYNGAKTPNMQAPDAYLSNALHVSATSNGGTLSGWDGAAPLGAVNWTEFWKTSNALGGAVGNVYVYETQEQIAIFSKNGTSVYGFFGGAIVDPLSGAALDAEADGRRYGVVTSGGVLISATMHNLTGAFGSHFTTNGNVHACVLDPGLSTFSWVSRARFMGAVSTSQQGILPSGGTC